MIHLVSLVCSSLFITSFVPVTSAQIQDIADGPFTASSRPGIPSGVIGLAPSRPKVLCRDGWSPGSIIDFSGVEIPICIRVNPLPQTWLQAQETCRKQYGFLLKLDSPAKIKDVNLMSYLSDNGMKRFWTGLHTYAEHLIWDDLIPNTVRPHNQPNDTSAPLRPWKWSTKLLPETSDYCGLLNIEDDDRKRRRKRAPDEDSSDGFDLSALRDRLYQFRRPSSEKFLPTAAFQSMLSRTQFTDQLPEVPGTSLGIQSEHQIPGSGLTDTNLQSGGLHTDLPTFDISSDDKDSPSSDNPGTPNIMQSGFFATESPLSQTDLLNSMKDMAAKLTGTNVPDSNSPLDTVQEIQKDLNDFSPEKEKLGDKSVIGEIQATLGDTSDMILTGLQSPQENGIADISKSNDDTGNDQKMEILNIMRPQPTKTTLADTSTKAFAGNKTHNTETVLTENTGLVGKDDSSSHVKENNEHNTKVDDLKENMNEKLPGSSDNLNGVNRNAHEIETANTIPENKDDSDQSGLGSANTDKNDETIAEKGLLADIIETSKDLTSLPSLDGNLPEVSGNPVSEVSETLADMAVDMMKNTEHGKSDDFENTKGYNDLLPEVRTTDETKPLDTVSSVAESLPSNDITDEKDNLLAENIHEKASDIISETINGETESKGTENEVLTDDYHGNAGNLLLSGNTASDTVMEMTDEKDLKDKIENSVEESPDLKQNELVNVSDISEKLNDYMEAVGTDEIKDTITKDYNEDILNGNPDEKGIDQMTPSSFSILDDLEDLKREEFSSENVTTERIDELSTHPGLDELIETKDSNSNSDDKAETIIDEILGGSTLNENNDQTWKDIDKDEHADDMIKLETERHQTDVLDEFHDRLEDIITPTSVDEPTFDEPRNTTFSEVDELLDDLNPDLDTFKTPETETDRGDDLGKELIEVTNGFAKSDDAENNELTDDLRRTTNNIEEDTLDVIENADLADDNHYDNDNNVTPGFEVDDEIQDGQERPDLAEDIQTGNTKILIPHQVTSQNMELSSCSARLPSVCFSYEVEVMTQASTCDDGWYGHVLLDSCYKILDGRLSYSQSISTCKSLQARVALGESEFERNFILLAIEKDGRQLNGERFWMEATPSFTGCKYFDESGTVLQTNCEETMSVVCVKDAKSLSVHMTNNSPLYDEHGLDMYTQEAEFKLFSSRDPGNSLICDLTSAASEFPVLWFKDGILVETRDKYVTTDISLHINESLVEAFRSVTNRDISIPALQGRYWCEVWDRKTLSRVRSKPYDVRFSDVISFHGSVQQKGNTKQQQLLFNMMNEMFPSLTNIEKDLKTLFEDALPALGAAFPDIVEVFTFADRVRSSPSVIEYHTFYTFSRDYTIPDESSLYSRLKAVLKTKLANPRYIASLPGQTPVSTFRSMSLQSTVSCPAAFLQTDLDVNGKRIPVKAFQFPKALLGEFANSIDNCSSSNNYPAGTARCLGDFNTGAYWGDVVANACIDETFIDEFNGEIWGVSPFTDKLSEIAQTVVKPENVDNVVSQVAHITEVAAKLTPTDINKIADVLDHTTQVGKLPEKVGKAVLKTVDKLMSSSEKEVHVANIETKAANRIIKSLERFAEQADLGDKQNVRMVSDNIVVELWDLQPNTEPVIGLAAETRAQAIDTPFKDDVIATVFNKSQLADANVDAAIELPKEVFNQKEKGVSLGNRLTMMVFRKSKLFRAALSSEGKIIKPSDEQLDKLNSYVISASIAGKKLTGLTENVRTIFRPLKDHAGIRSCVWWDFELNNMRGGWSSAGCYYDGKINGRDICLCDHLTNFAVLLDFYGQAEPIPDHHELSLSIITVLGLACSILGLSLTIISYVFFRKLRQGRAQQTLFNLSLALLFSMLVFLVGIKQTHNYVGCLVVAILLHYFILVSFMWMLMEAILQYLTFVKILGTYITRFTLKTVLPAWGLPLVPVIAVLSVDYHLYHGGPNYCWMDLPAFYFAFAIPITCIIAINIVIFFITIVSIFRRGKGLRSNQKKQKMAMTNLQAAITSFILLGLTWVFGYLAISDARLPFQYVFTILNSLQGFFIFVLFVVRKKKVRDQWYAICCKAGEKDRVSRSLSASNSIPSSYSNGSNRNSRKSKHERDRSDSTKTTQSTFSSSSGGFTNYGYDNCYEIPYNRHGRRFRKF